MKKMLFFISVMLGVLKDNQPTKTKANRKTKQNRKTKTKQRKRRGTSRQELEDTKKEDLKRENSLYREKGVSL